MNNLYSAFISLTLLAIIVMPMLLGAYFSEPTVIEEEYDGR